MSKTKQNYNFIGFILFITAVLLGNVLSVQSQIIDSLRQKLDTSKADNAIVDYAADLVVKLIGIDKDGTEVLVRAANLLIPNPANFGEKAMTLQKISIGYHETEQSDIILTFLEEAKQLAEEIGFKKGLTFPLIGPGIIYEKMGQLNPTDMYLQKTLDISNKYADNYVKVYCLLHLRRSLRNREEIPGAISLPKEGYLQSESMLLAEKKDIAKQLYQIYKAQDKLSGALSNHERFKTLHDARFNEEEKGKPTGLELGYKFEEEEYELKDQDQSEALMFNIRLQRQHFIQVVIIIVLAIALFFTLTIAGYYCLKCRINLKLSKLNMKIAAQKKRLRRLDHLRFQFLTNISYEFRTPLTVISLMVEQIKDLPDQRVKKVRKIVRSNASNLLNLVNQVLELCKLETDSRELNLMRGDIVSYLRYIMESFRFMAERKGIRLHFLCDEMEIITDFDKEKILGIVSNLLSNAIGFGTEGGQAYLMVSMVPEGPLTPQGLEIKVWNTGIEISEEKRPYFFDCSCRANDSAPGRSVGTGIYLSLTKALVELMKGTIQVESAPGKETVFIVFLPISGAAHKEASMRKTNKALSGILNTYIPDETTRTDLLLEALSGDDGKPVLLIIEDNINVVEYLESLLDDQYQLEVAFDGQEGIETAFNKIPDLILSDVMMPGKDGFEVCKTLKGDDRTSHIPIVLLTAKADVESRVAGLEHGADTYLTKPFNEKELSVTLEKLLDLRRVLQKRYRFLDQMVPSEDVATQQEDAFITKLRNIVEKNLTDEEFGISELCTVIGMSRTQLHLKIKALTDQPTSHFIRMTRLQKAKELLKQSDLNITEIAYEVGFQSISYFSRSFIEEFGITPSEFRNR
ncbi:MAG: response regulator [Cytophagales bacterium]|nr:response regulator [Cytophagales bacterium]